MRLTSVPKAKSGARPVYVCAECTRATRNAIADLDASPGTYYCEPCAESLYNEWKQGE